MIDNYEYALIAANMVAYVLIILALLKGRTKRFPENVTLEQAFRILEASLKESFPELPEGYTWKEIITKLRSTRMNIDWWEVEDTLKKYEAHRYGGFDFKNPDPHSVLRIAQQLPRGAKIVN
jgi:hypothetical protein